MITVIVPIHNTEQYINKCLDSIINQSYKELEILLIDSSTDNTRKIINKYLKTDKRITYIYHKNNSYGFKINHGIKMAHGEYISIIDSDDYIHKNFYKYASNYLDNKLDFIKFDFYKVYYKNKKVIKYTYNLGNKSLYNKVCNSKRNPELIYSNCTTIGSGIYSRSFLKKYHIKLQESPGASFQDTSFYILTHLFAKSLLYINKAFYFYRTDNNNSSIHKTSNLSAIYNEHKYIEKILKNKKISKKIRDSLLYKEIMDYAWNYNRLNKTSRYYFLKIIKNRLNNVHLQKDAPYIIINKFNKLKQKQ